MNLLPATRNTDPRTSFDAERSHATKRRSNIEYIVRLVKKYPGMTSGEIADFSRMDRTEVSRRLSDAKNKGLLTASNPRKCSIKGTNMMCWSIA